MVLGLGTGTGAALALVLAAVVDVASPLDLVVFVASLVVLVVDRAINNALPILI